MTDQRIKTFLLDDMQNAPFVVAPYCERLPCTFVQDRNEADLIVGRWTDMFAKEIPTGRRYLLWTHEPAFDTSRIRTIEKFMPESLPGAALDVFNVHNGAVYTDNFYLAPLTRRMPQVRTESEFNVPFTNKTITFAATYRLDELWVGGEDISLNRKRCELASELHAMGVCRILGRNWPNDMSEGDSRYVNRANSKMEFFKEANFALCLENTCASYYVTEKLWEAIYGGSLPVYWSNDTIYLNFPRDSFVDVRDYPTAAALHEFIAAMPAEEYLRRLNLCRRTYNTVVLQGYRKSSRERSLLRLVAHLEGYIAAG